MAIRLANTRDLDRIMLIVDSAREYFASAGIPQWQDGYPSHTTFEDDITLNRLYVYEEEDTVLGLYCYDNGGDDNYTEIWDGSFSSNEPYAAIHRIAVAPEAKGKGIAVKLTEHATALAISQGFSYIRGDTHRLNLSMQRLLAKSGFAKCGIIYVDKKKTPENERFAFEKRIHL